jgi:hypothetical protein
MTRTSLVAAIIVGVCVAVTATLVGAALVTIARS